MFENVVMAVQAVISRQGRLFISHLSFSCDTLCLNIELQSETCACEKHTLPQSQTITMFEISKDFL